MNLSWGWTWLLDTSDVYKRQEVISVSALNRYVKNLLDVNDVLFDLALRGEIANFCLLYTSHFCHTKYHFDLNQLVEKAAYKKEAAEEPAENA